jgi:peptidoglycan/LPS O-acetylase OafA/YrhL
MALRAARLWPMLCIGVLPGLIVLNGWLSAPAAAPAAPAPAGAEVPAGLALIFPVNPAYWSLLFEMLAYLGFALAAHRLKVAGLVWVMAISALALAGMTVWGSNLLHEYGSFWATFPHGLARVGYSFTCGVLVYRLRLAGGMPAVTSSLAWAVPGGLVAVMLLVPVPGQLAGLLGVLLALPALLWLATKWEVPQHRLADGLSDLSYPLYCLHMPCLVLASIFGMPMVLAWVAMASASLLLDRWVDRPLRDMLRGSVLAGVARPKAA